MRGARREGSSLAAGAFLVLFAPPLAAALPPAFVPRFPMPKSGLELERPVRSGAFFDVVGRRSALFGYETRGLEAWVYPLKLVDDFRLSFRLEGYPLDIEGSDVVASIQARPEATTLTYSHPAFTVRQVLFAPLEEPAAVMLLDVDSTLPMTVTGSFRPRLRLMWPAGLMTGNVGWDEKAHLYTITEESKRFVAVIGCPGATDTSVMPYQEEPRDAPLRFVVEVSRERMRTQFLPILFVGGVEGKDKARADYDRLLASVPALYGRNVAYYHALQERTASVSTPDERLDTAFAWAKVGMDKGLATNPLLGTGLLAGFRTSGESERPGFAWLFGRDALWTALALDAEGDFGTVRTALDFLKKFQRADGKIPHEISQSASLIPWFTDYPYPWNSADATPLYVAVHADRFRATGDLAYVRESWESIVKAWHFTAATDTDGNGLVENTKFGHGWVEGGALYPPHEEIYMQGVWIEACRGLAEMADAVGDAALAGEARAWADRTRAAMEKTYWLAGRGFYGFATKRPDEKRREAEPGPDRERRQARMDELKDARFVDEDTALPAVPAWWHTLEDERAQSEIDHLGGAELAADWGQRILSERSHLYDPLSYHYGSVWPLFTGWTAVGAYRYGRPHVGYQATMANALLAFDNALGYVTELLSGAFDAPFTRSSHHQVWSEAMVVSPVLRGLFGLEAGGGGRALTFAPQLPADWERAELRNVAVGEARLDLALERRRSEETVTVVRRGGDGPVRVRIAPAFPLDARVRSVDVDGRPAAVSPARLGDGQRLEAELDVTGTHRVVFRLDEGTGVYMAVEAPRRGQPSQGLRILRARADGGRLRLVLDGRAGRTYAVGVRGPRRPQAVPGVTVDAAPNGDARLRVSFEGPDGAYVRRDLDLELR
ncbi:MAG: amylo-alpha-1,6-glucosidase [Acidobacteria bacterium]|nr:MAG: amylo-alpha-1,6-glucosidase [Acidobacteriota bacterium]